jgi:hypothetical protein
MTIGADIAKLAQKAQIYIKEKKGRVEKKGLKNFKRL